MNLTKAFDSVGEKILIAKFHAHWISIVALKLVKNFAYETNSGIIMKASLAQCF